VLATYGGVGHAAAGSAPTLALLADTSHLAAASVWIGGLIILAACLLPRLAPRSWPRPCRATPGSHSAAWPCSP
jgi:Putative copper export protein